MCDHLPDGVLYLFTPSCEFCVRRLTSRPKGSLTSAKRPSSPRLKASTSRATCNRHHRRRASDGSRRLAAPETCFRGLSQEPQPSSHCSTKTHLKAEFGSQRRYSQSRHLLVLLKKHAPDDAIQFILNQLDKVALGHDTFTVDALRLIARSSEGGPAAHQKPLRRFQDGGDPRPNQDRRSPAGQPRLLATPQAA